ncbi:MAG TPA: uracil-DNA glycosylase [Polyangia bacterium]|nr:uracil-DNA glycosylase [Polyangia bacterium]
MSDRDELLQIVRQVKEHAAWLERGGVAGVPRAIGESARPRAAATATATATATGNASVNARVNMNANATPNADGVAKRALALVRDELGDCTRCKLHPLRKNIVFGVGNPDAPLVFVGEAPGGDEDRTGEPFVGAAGQLLTKMIVAMGLSREEVYICNILKCRPPGNRNPEPDEIAECEPFLKKQLAAIRPRMIVCLGKFAAQCLLRSDAPISRLRGQFKSYEGIPLMPTFHPAFLLRNPSAKREVWSDLQLVMAELDRLGIARRKS